MTTDIPPLIELRDFITQQIKAPDAQGLPRDVWIAGLAMALHDKFAAALEAQSTELAQMNERIDVLAEERARRYHEGACRYQIERDAARTAIREALAAWHRGMTLGDTQYIVNDQTIDLAMTDIWDALSRDLQEGGN